VLDEGTEIKPAAKGKRKKSVCMDSDEEEQELAENMMEKQCFDLD